ncbi:LOW QUALITY PROTEIN: hypothetical protein HJC23_005054 [Cyclotella cryptica]|uniref:Sulfhydryl oxidase n=1 Tax=Cyclotella cryptica TaxID=29204 RepID=A0ABD3QF47_9STRA
MPPDYSGDERKESSKRQPGAEYDEERHIKPYILKPENGPRVVQFYSPWSGHCQSYKAKYIDVAKEINLRTPLDQPEITFHAISCSVYHWVCVQNKIKGFPTIFALKANSAEPQILKDPSADEIAHAVGVKLKPLDQDYTRSQKTGDDTFRPVDILGASIDGLVRTREAVYIDAALSFTHALKTEIYSRQGYLDSSQRETFSDWIDLLYWALPPTWILHTLINDIRNNMDSVMLSEENLLYLVNKHNEVVNGKQQNWSPQCSKGTYGQGYPCGLWSLFHIVSIGVIERHRAVLGAKDQISTEFAAQTMRNYVEHFFGCESCRKYFLDMYDNCGFNHCQRFKQPKKLPPPESWNQFALWLWEVHNDVNKKVIEAESSRERVASLKQKLQQAAWPTTDVCPECKDKRGKWNIDVVLRHLKKQYWPGGVQNFRYVVLKKKESKNDEKAWRGELLENTFFVLVSVGIIIWCTKKQYVSFTGQHKKYEDFV